MGESDRYQEYKHLSRRRFSLGQPGNALVALVAINLVVFFLVMITRVFFLQTHQGEGMQTLDFDAIKWVALPAGLGQLARTPWTLFTFMFAHGGGKDAIPQIVTIVSNMLWLWAFGYIMQDLSGNKLIFPVYIYGSLLGAVFYLTAVNAIPSLRPFIENGYLSGAEPGTAALAIAVTALAPGYKIFRHLGSGIPVWVLTGAYVIIKLVIGINTGNPTGLAFAGGCIAGYLFVRLYRRGTDLSTWMIQFYEWISNLFTPGKKQNSNQSKEKIFYNTGGRSPYQKTPNLTQQRVDEILDKISQKGYHFLTDEEKNILRRASEEDL
ncbi:MAG: rhomboid family intramembrane serine protease [Bacteroidetes bacterium]|nr:rhomboid family intramembrane serine protease [Bacteroidota bacterium]